jgi:hypothetical protein
VPVPTPGGAKAPFYLRATPSTRDFSNLGGPFLRAMTRIEEKLYIVSGGALWRVEAGGAATYLTALPDDPNTALVGHRSSVVIAANSD